jgi:biopolymer transport protein ExbD
MAISLTQNAEEPFSEINTTPLIDVMLVLLIVFIITLPAITHSVNLNLAHAPVLKSALAPIEIGVDFDGTLTLNGAEVSNLTALESYLVAEGAKVEQRELHVRADQRAKYDTVAKVLAIAQRSGLKRIGIDGNE